MTDCRITRSDMPYNPKIVRPLLVLLLFLVLPCSLRSQNAHPRIWLDSTTLTRLTALKNANDVTWVKLKADADTYAADTVDAYDNGSCATSHICFPYSGYGWGIPLETLSLAYKMTGSTNYSNQVKAILNVMVAAGVTPETVDTGYPSRIMVLGLGLAYDWCYDQLSTTDKANITRLLDIYWTWVQANGYQWNCSKGCPIGTGNYLMGHILGFGVAALAVEGDDTNSATIQTGVLNNFNTYVVPEFTSNTTGAFQGGYTIEGWQYGGPNFVRLFQYMKAMTTAGKTDLFNNNIAWLKNVAKNLIYQEQPDDWSINDEGDWSGELVRVFHPAALYDIAGLLTGTTEGGWSTFQYNNLQMAAAEAIGGFSASYLAAPTNFELFLYNTGQSGVDYTTTQPLYFYSVGDQHTFARTDWTTSAAHVMFTSLTKNLGDHQTHEAGHVAIQRGMDYLLVNAGMWRGKVDISGQPSTNTGGNLYGNWNRNTLFYYDGATDCADYTMNLYYTGCQGFAGQSNSSTLKHKEGTGFVFQEADLRTAYYNQSQLTTITSYWRTFVSIGGDICFVFDRISAPSTSTRTLYWHTPALTTATAPGNATATSISGTVATVTVGASKLWIDTLLPTSPTITRVDGLDAITGTTKVGYQSFTVSDPAAGSCSTNCLFLTILAPTPSGASQPTMSLITATGYYGAFYNDGITPRVAMFSTNGTSHTSVTYTATYSAGLPGRHVITDLAPGVYSVLRDGSTILTNQTVGGDGSLSFTATGGTTYVIQASGPSPALPPPPTGLGGTAR
jgi:hypothetical protein